MYGPGSCIQKTTCNITELYFKHLSYMHRKLRVNWYDYLGEKRLYCC